MPKSFNNSNDTSSVGPGSFREQAYVDDEGSLTGLDKALEGAAAFSSDLVVGGFQKQAEKEAKDQEELYSKARELKRNIYDAGLAGDQKAELEFQSKLEDLKIAERQGAISGSNSSIRQETLLKGYVNRFPHLEERFRKSYSSTRARAEASREQFEDPIEAGIDQVIKEATAAGMTVGSYLNVKAAQEKAKTDIADLEYRAKLGVSIENDVDAMFQSSVIPLSMASASRTIAQQVQNYKQQGIEYDAGKAKADFLFRAQQEAAIVTGELYNILRSSKNPDATLSREFVEAKRQQVLNAYKQIADSGVFESFDTLNSMKRSMEIGTQQAFRDMAKFSPLMAEFVKNNPKEGFAFVFEDFNKVLGQYKAGRRAELAAIANSPDADPITQGRLSFQIAVIDAWGQGELARDVTGATELGTPPPQSRDPGVDAAKMDIINKSVLGSKTTTPQQKSNTIKAGLEAEARAKRPSDAPGPSAVWYKDPIRRRAIQTNPEAGKEMTTRIDNAAAALFNGDIQKFSPNLGGLSFTPQPEFEDAQQPWKFYGDNGGPFGAPKDTAEGFVGDARITRSLVAGGTDRTIKGLNNMYWNYRLVNGRDAAEAWAQDLVGQFKAAKEEEKAAKEAEAKANKEATSSAFDLPDVGLTD